MPAYGRLCGDGEDTFHEVINLTSRNSKASRRTFRNGELETTKEQLKGNLLLGLESSDNMMTRLAKNEIYFESYLPVDQVLKGIAGSKKRRFDTRRGPV